MNKHILFGFFVVFLAFSACKTTKVATDTQKSPDLLVFKNESVNKAEFERVYQKNNGGYEEAKNHTTEQYREYLDLYINFKRKVFEAEEVGLDTTAAFKQEFQGYQKQLAQPYLNAKEVEEKLIKEAYDRSKMVINAAHLLISVTPEASPRDTLNAYNKILAYRDSVVLHGKDFNEIAARHSQDPSAKDNKGDLGYFSVFDMVYPFESAAYETNAGEVSMPARTRYGYHILKVNEKLNSSGKKRAAHIIIRIGKRYSAKDTTSAQNKINEIYKKLENGEDFAKLAEQYSDDPTTAKKGGDLGQGRLLPSMEVRKLKLEKGEFSEPFETKFGWHILQVTEVEPLANFEEAKAGLKNKVKRDSRARISRDALLNRIKKENKYTFYVEAFDEFKKSLTPNFKDGNWEPKEENTNLYSRGLFELAVGTDVEVKKSLNDFIEYYKNSRLRNAKLSASQAADEFVKKYIEQELLAFEEAQLPSKNPEYRNLLKEYRDGILLFTLMEKKVWKKAVEDTTGLEAFYDANKEMFKADQMVDVKEYRSDDKGAIEKVVELLKQDTPATDIEIDSIINAESSLKLRITNQTFEKGKSDVDEVIFSKAEGEKTGILNDGGFYKLMIVEKSYPAGVKPFEKAKSECITKYQDHLEATWLKELEAKYPVKINEEQFGKLFE